MSLIREDKHGLYIKSDGRICRPQKSKWAYSINPKWDLAKSRFRAGQKVPAYYVPTTPYARVGKGDEREIWWEHGVYLTEPGKSSEHFWEPKE